MKKLFLLLAILDFVVLFNSCNTANSRMAVLGYASRVRLREGLDSLYTINNLLSHFPRAYDEGHLRSKEWCSEYSKAPFYMIDWDTIWSYLSSNAYFVEKKTKDFIDSLVSNSSFSDIIPYSSDSILHAHIYNMRRSDIYTRKYNRVGPNVDTNRAPIPDFADADFGLGEVADDTLGFWDDSDSTVILGDRLVLPDDLIVYVLESKSGDFWKVKNTEPRPVVLSQKWKHGYSKGYAISSSLNMVCYWMMAW